MFDSLLAFSYIGLMRRESPTELWGSSRILRGTKSSDMLWSLWHEMAWALQYPRLVVSGFWIGKILHVSQPFLNKNDANNEDLIDKTNIRNFLKWLSLVNKDFMKHGAFRRTFSKEYIAELGLLSDARPGVF